MSKFFLKIMLFIIILVSISFVLNFLLDRYYVSHNYHSKSLWAACLRNRNAEVALLGSSRIANMLDSREIEKITNKTCINLASSGAGYAENYLILDRYLQNNIHPRYVVLNIDEPCLSIDYSTYALGFKHFELSPLFYEKEVNEIYKNVSSNYRYYSWYVLPFSKYVEFNDRIQLYQIFKDLKLPPKKPDYDTLYGDNLIKTNKQREFKNDTLNLCLRINKTNEFYLHKILQLCKKNNIRTILITSPLWSGKSNLKQNRVDFYNYLNKLTKTHSVSYLDFSNEASIQHEEYFYDCLHTNSSGSILFSKVLAHKFLDIAK